MGLRRQFEIVMQNHSILMHRLIVEVEVNYRWSLIRRRCQIEIRSAKIARPPATEIGSVAAVSADSICRNIPANDPVDRKGISACNVQLLP